MLNNNNNNTGNDKMCECEICHRIFNKENINDICGYSICDECVDEDAFAICNHCGSLIEDKDDANIYEDNYYCNACVTTCSECSCVMPSADAVENAYGSSLCDECLNENYFECQCCHGYYTYDDQYDFDYDNYCEVCYHSILSNYGIHPYNFKPDYHFLEMQDEPQSRNNNLHVGIELEIQGENRNNFCDDINKFFDNENIYLKMDGSLNSKGIEIISMPMTFKYLTEGIDWKYCFDELKIWQMNDTEDCGLHFHLDRNYLSADNIRTIDFIVNYFSEYFMNVGGREFSYYCQKRDKSYFDWGKDVCSRYSAVNLENTSTVELRFFKSTYNYETFIQRIKIVFAIVQFSKMYIVSSLFGWSNTCFIEKFNDLYKTMFGDYPNLELD